MFEKLLFCLLCLGYGSTISFCYQNETRRCSRDSTDPSCSHDNFKQCLIERYFRQDVTGQPGCMNSCESMLGQNANETMECLAEYQAEKMAHKLKEAECEMSESQRVGIMTQQPITPPPMNMTEIMKYKIDKSFVENYVPLKMFKKCVKNCQKNAAGMSTKGKKHAKQPKNMDFHLCYEQAFKKPYLQVKGSKTASKYCSMKLKTEKYAEAARFSECMKNALGNISNQNVQEEESSEEEED